MPIYYESRLAKIELDDESKELLDEEIAEVTEDELAEQQDRIKRKWSQVEALVGSSKRLRLIAEDLIEHFESRLNAMDGKAMIVCMSRRICVDLYAEIVRLRPDWHSDKDDEGVVKVVMTGSDAPCMHTMYIDKPMRGHGLMQAIARVNRVSRTSPAA